MGKRKAKRQPDFLEVLYELIDVLPWWGGPLVVAAVFGVARWGVPILSGILMPDDPAMQPVLRRVIETFAPIAAWVLAALCTAFWIASLLRKWMDRRRLDVQSGFASIAALDWHAFERLLAEAFRREGYRVELTGGAGPDGGVDIRLLRDGRVTLVQCKQYRARQVGVRVVRELLGVVAKERAAGGVVVTSGRFTRDAVDCAEGTSIDLIDGPRLEVMIRAAQGAPMAVMAATGGPPACPACGGGMVARTASRGANAGKRFWGCTRYPACRGTRPLDA